MVQKEVLYTRIFQKNKESRAKTIINVGGKGSSKSWSIAQLLIYKMVNERNKVIGICRKTFPALRMTAMKLFVDLMKDYGIYDETRHNKSFNTYEHGSNLVQFFGLDEEQKARSADFSYIWMEEANEFTYNDYTTFKLQLRRAHDTGELNQLYMSLNPTDGNNWIAKRVINEVDIEVIKSTYKDNSFLSPEYVKTLTDLVLQDENYYRVYALGEWGRVEGRIFTNYEVIPQLPLMDGAKWCYGLDFGLVNPSAIVKVYILDDRFYVEERLYQTGLTNSDIIEFFTHEARGDIYADPSAKMMIEEIYRAGFNAYQGHRDVKDGIDVCQRTRFLIPQDSVNLIKELMGYTWKKDPNDPEHFLTEPVKFSDHLMDAMRYAIYGLNERFGFATQRPISATPIKTLHFGSPVRRF